MEITLGTLSIATTPDRLGRMDFAAAFRQQNRMFADVLAAADPERPVPACPGWTLSQLMTHVGRGDRWAATIVSTRADDVVDPKSVPGGKPPAEHDDAVAWLAEGPTLLLDAVAEGPDVPVWTFTGPRPASWWVRRRLHEVLVHRADALLALDRPVDADPALAADGVAEWLSLLADFRRAPALDDGMTLHLHATDTDGEWTLRRVDEGLVWSADHTKATVALRGPAMDLLLVLLRRLPADQVEVFGDRTVFAGFLEHTPF